MGDETLRETLEAAYEEVGTDTPAPAASEETGRSTSDAPEPVRDTAPTEKSTGADEPAADSSGERKRGERGRFVKKTDGPQSDTTAPEPATATPETTPEQQPAEARPSIRAPESWKPGAREHWAKLPPDVQAEVSRREKEITSTLQTTAEDRKLASHFKESIRPFEAMILSENRDPVSAARELFATAHMLRNGTQVQKAQLVATMIKNFSVPIETLDALLVGEQAPDEDSKLQRLLDERLKPVQEFISQINGVKQQRTEATNTEVQTEIQKFAEDPKNEFFDDVREDMADLMEVSSRRGRSMSLSEAYDKAVQMNPEIKKVLDKRKADELQSKRDAAVSVAGGAPVQTASVGSSGSLREDVERAFSSVANR